MNQKLKVIMGTIRVSLGGVLRVFAQAIRRPGSTRALHLLLFVIALISASCGSNVERYERTLERSFFNWPIAIDGVRLEAIESIRVWARTISSSIRTSG